MRQEAFYPADPGTNRTDGNYFFNIAEYKDLSEQFSADIPMGSYSGTEKYEFKHITGAALLTFSNFPANVKTAEISISNNSYRISGSFQAYIASEMWTYGARNAASESEKVFTRKVAVENGVTQVYLPYAAGSKIDVDCTVNITGYTETGKSYALLVDKVMPGNSTPHQRAVVLKYPTLELPDYTDWESLDWNAENVAVAVNDETATSDLRYKELRAFVDDNNLYLRLKATIEEPFGANYLDVVFSDGDGADKAWWGWNTKGTNNYWKEHKGTLDASGNLTSFKFQHEGTYKDIMHSTELSETEVIWYLKFPREYVDKYVSSRGTLYVGGFLWQNSDPYWAIPARGGDMLKVTVFEDPNSLKKVDWNAENIATYVLDDFMYGSYPQYCALTELKAFADETNIYARLKSTTTSGAAKIKFCTADTGEGSQSVWYWEKSTYATPVYISGGANINSDFVFGLSYNGEAIALETVVEGTDVYWLMTIPRSAHDHTKNPGSVNIGFLTYDAAGSENGFMPKIWGEMLEVTLP